MSKGMLNNPAGPRNNFGYQISALQLLGAISASVAPPGGLATEATALNILSAIQSGQEFEQNIVVDLGGVGCPNNCPTYLMVRIWNTVTHTFDPPIYYDASGVVVVPVGPVELVNPQFVLNNILAQVTAINADLDVALSTRASELTLLATNALLTTLNSTVATEATLQLVLGSITAGNAAQATAANQAAQNIILTAISSALDVALSTRASEATLASLNNKFTAVVRTPTMTRASAPGNVPAGARSASFYNAGGANATVLGASLLPGEQVSFSAGAEDDTLAVIAYDGTGTDLLITTVA